MSVIYFDDLVTPYLYARSILQGVGEQAFAPKKRLTRANFSLILARIAGQQIEMTKSAISSFVDVNPNAYYTGAVEWAVEQGIVSGMGDGKFAPKEEQIREQMAVMLVRFAN